MMLKSFFSELRLYICNEWISRIPNFYLRQWFYKSIMKFELHKSCTIFMHCTFEASKGLSIGLNSVINSRCQLDTRGKITIGSNVAISKDVIIITADHNLDMPNFPGRNREVIIEDFVWIGTRATILPGVVLGKGSVVAAASVVTKSVPPFSIIAGVPAKIIKIRREDIKYETYYRRLFQ